VCLDFEILLPARVVLNSVREAENRRERKPTAAIKPCEMVGFDRCHDDHGHFVDITARDVT